MMKLETFNDPVITMPQLIAASFTDRATVENWIRYRHLVAARDTPGRSRRFNLADFIRLEVTLILRDLLQIKVELAAKIAKLAVAAYASQAWADDGSGADGRGDTTLPDFKWQFSMARMPGGGLSIGQVGDVPADVRVDLTVPVGSIVRSCINRIEVMRSPKEQRQ